MPEETIEQLVETNAKAVLDMRGRVEETEKGLKGVNKTLEGFADLDGIDKDSIVKANETATEAIQGVRDLQAKLKVDEWQKSLDDLSQQNKDIQQHLAMQKGGLAQSVPGGVSKYEKDLGKSMRKPGSMKAGITAIAGDELEAQAKKMVDFYGKHLDDEQKASITKAVTAGLDAQGGYWVPIERVQRMVQRIFETNPMRQICSIMSTGTDMVEMIVDDNELSAVWGGELHTITNTDTPEIGLVEIPVHELYARPLITLKMLEDASIDVVGWLSDKAVDRFSRSENTAYLVGDGSQRPLGALSYPDYSAPGVYTRGAVEQVTSGAAGGLGTSGEGIIKIYNSLKDAYQPGAVWLTKRASFFEFMRLRDLDGQYLFRFGDALAKGIPLEVFGKPLFFADDMPEFANDSLSVAYGNFQAGYQIVDRMGITVLVDPYSQDPQVRYRFRKRTGGRVVNFEAIKLLKLAA